MSDGFGFAINLSGNFAAQLAPVNAGLIAADSNARKAADSFNILDHVTIDLAETARMAFDGLKEIGRAAFDLGRDIVKVAADSKDLDLALNLNLGEAGAKRINALAELISSRTRFDDDAIKNAVLPLTEQGITDAKLLGDLTTAAVDIATRRKQGIDGVNQSLEAFSKIALKGEVDGKMLKQLAIAPTDYFKDLADLLHTSAKRAEELTKAGKVTKETLLSVALNQVAQRQGGELGIAAIAGGENLGATLQRFSDLPENMMRKLADSPAMDKIKGILDGFIEKMMGPDGAKIMDRIGAGMERIANAITPATIDRMITGLGAVAKVAEVLLTTFSGLATVIDHIAGGKGMDSVNAGFHTTAEDRRNIERTSMKAIGEQSAAGYVEGLSSMAPAVSEVFESSVDAGNESLGIQSPSKVFAEMGRYSAEGFAEGLDDGGDKVDAARSRITDASMGGDGGSSSAASVSDGGSVVNNFYFQGDGADDMEQRVEGLLMKFGMRSIQRLGIA